MIMCRERVRGWLNRATEKLKVPGKRGENVRRPNLAEWLEKINDTYANEGVMVGPARGEVVEQSDAMDVEEANNDEQQQQQQRDGDINPRAIRQAKYGRFIAALSQATEMTMMNTPQRCG